MPSTPAGVAGDKNADQLPEIDMETALPIADQVFIQIFQECLLPRGLRPHDLFEEIDADNSGEITLDEFREGLFVKFSIELTDREFAAVSLVADADGSGDIGINELCAILSRGENAEAAADRIFHDMWQTLTLKGMRVTQLFHYCDEDGSGEISLDELRDGMDSLLGLKLTEHEFGCISQVADKDNSGDVSVKELVRIVARGDMKRQEFRKVYVQKMKVAGEVAEHFRIKTPVTPTSDDDENEDKPKMIVVDGKAVLQNRTPSPGEGFDMMGVARYGPDNDLSQTVVRPTVWGKTDRLRIHKPPAARRKEWKKAVGRPDLWHLKLRQQNYIPEQILSAPNRPKNRVRKSTHRSRAIEAAAAAAKAYQDGPPSHGTHEQVKKGISLVEKAARSQIFGDTELQGLAQEVRQRATLTSGTNSKRAAHNNTTKSSSVLSPPSPTSGLEDMSMMSVASGGSALPSGYGYGLNGSAYEIGNLNTRSMTYNGKSFGICHPGHQKMSGHMLQMSEPLYWRKRVKHPSAQHRIQHTTEDPQLAYSCTLTPRDNLNDQQSRPSMPTRPKGTSSRREASRKHPQDHRTLSFKDDAKPTTQQHEHLALEDASFVMARAQAHGLRQKLKDKQRMNFAKAVYLGEPAALRKAVEIQEQYAKDVKANGGVSSSKEFQLYVRREPHRPPPAVGSENYLLANEKARRIALHTECTGYTKSKANTQNADSDEEANNDAATEFDEIKKFEQRQAKHGHEWEPTTGKDWHREQRFLNGVAQQQTKDPKLLQGFSQFRKDYKRKSKSVLKKVAEKGFEYVKAMNKMHFRGLHQYDDGEDLTQKTARNRWRKGNVGAKIKVKGDRIRADALKEREARLLSLRHFSGFGRRHLEFISEQLYMSIMRMPQPPGGKVKKPMKIMAEAFDAIDEDLSGSIDSSEFRSAMMRLDLGLSQEAITELLEVIDKDGDGQVDKTEFLASMKYVHKKVTNLSYEDND